MSKSPALVLTNVSRVFDGNPPVVAVSNVSFELCAGRFAALVGPSGSGKTTLLNLSAGLDVPTSGEVRIAGRLLAELSKHETGMFRRKHVGFVFQSYNLFPALTVLANVEFTSVVRGDDSRERRERAHLALAQVGLTEKTKFFPDQLSGGQQQRVAVARALASQPDIVFADEPTANLDSKTALDLIALFERLNADLGVTFLFSTHDQRLVERVKTEMPMSDGRIIESVRNGRPEASI